MNILFDLKVNQDLFKNQFRLEALPAKLRI
jgi:hypothetical protein